MHLQNIFFQSFFFIVFIFLPNVKNLYSYQFVITYIKKIICQIYKYFYNNINSKSRKKNKKDILLRLLNL